MTDQRPPATDSVEGDGPLPGLLVPQGMLRRLAAELSGRFAGVFSAETVERYVFESYTALLRTAGVHTHLVALTQRFATDRLTALAQAKGAAPKDAPEVLFVCVSSACTTPAAPRWPPPCCTPAPVGGSTSARPAPSPQGSWNPPWSR
jgi:hypothetical protein